MVGRLVDNHRLSPLTRCGNLGRPLDQALTAGALAYAGELLAPQIAVADALESPARSMRLSRFRRRDLAIGAHHATGRGRPWPAATAPRLLLLEPRAANCRNPPRWRRDASGSTVKSTPGTSSLEIMDVEHDVVFRRDERPQS